MEAKALEPHRPQGETAEEEPEEDQQTDEELRKTLSPIDRQYMPLHNVPRRIHIVGTGSIGKIVAHALRGIENPPPITLIFHRYKLLKAWEASKQVITVQDEEYTIERGGFDVELAPETKRMFGVKLEEGEPDFYEVSDETGVKPHAVAQIVADQREAASRERQAAESNVDLDPSEQEQQISKERKQRHAGDYAVSTEPIHNLIITTKTIRTINALTAIRHRLTKDSTICFLQNGMGVIDDVNEHVFPDEATRPNYVQGIISHGANVPPEKAAQDPFFVVHAGKGTIALGIVPKRALGNTHGRPSTPTGPATGNDGKLDDTAVEDIAPTARYTIRTISRTPVLGGIPFTPLELLQLQLEKLAVNSIINPLTSLLDHRNGQILYNFPLTRTRRLMLAETSLIIRSLPELRGLPNVPHRFSAERLESLVVALAHKTKDNVSSMLSDVRAGRQTEIEYINGYIVKRGEELGVKAVVNYAMMQTVLGKCLMVQREWQDSIPVEREGGEERGLNRE